MSTRTGNTHVPDKTWSDWSQPLPAPGKVTSPAARFVQVRARFARDPNAVLSEIILPYEPDNLRAVVTSIDAQPKAGSKENAAPGEPETPHQRHQGHLEGRQPRRRCAALPARLPASTGRRSTAT